jgi:hypothetical protein
MQCDIRGYIFDVYSREDGYAYVTCSTLPGFRSLVHPNANLTEWLSEALDIFLPLYDKAKAG